VYNLPALAVLGNPIDFRAVYDRDAAEARQVLDTLPLVQEKLITFEVIPLQPYPGLARLFGGNVYAD